MSTKTSQRATRVVACAGGGRTRLEDRAVRAPAPGEMLLALRSCGLCGTDLFKLTYDSALPGTVLGHEIVGVVAEVGEGIRDFAPGHRVVVPHHVACGTCPQCVRGSETLCPVFRENLLEPGGFSEWILVRERAARLAARRIPDGIRDESAIFMEPAACVLRGVWKAQLPSEDVAGATAVIVGAGSMGLLHLLVLRAIHPRLRVLVSDTRMDRLEMATRLGADGACTPDAIADAVRAATGGAGSDAVFDTVGGSRILEDALAMTLEGGAVVLFAHAPEGDRALFDLNRFFKNERRVIGTYSGALREQEEVFRLIVTGRLDASPLVTHRFPLSRFDEGVDLTRNLEALKVLFSPEAP